MPKLFILMAMLCGFFISAEYAITRPVSNSVFIHAYSSAWFPYAWLAMVPLNFLIVSFYNRFLPRLGCLKMFFCVLAVVMLGNSACAFALNKTPGLPFLFFIWKEIYILLMFQQLWSVIHSNAETSRAKYLYGVIFGVGGVGGALGSLIPGFCAVKMGSESLLLCTLPLYSLLALCFFYMIKNSSPVIHEIRSNQRPSFGEGVKLLTNSRILCLILGLVVLMQLASTFVDYQFNHLLERAIPEKDLRTEYFGKMHSLISTLTAGLQFIGTFLFVHFLGLKRSHLMVPLVLGCNALAFFCFPLFGMISFSYVTIKTFDFSVFLIIKEMLYIPLKVEEKFRAKALIDVFAYRSSKALASSLILILQLVAGFYALSLLSVFSILVFALWCVLISLFFKTNPTTTLSNPASTN